MLPPSFFSSFSSLGFAGDILLTRARSLLPFAVPGSPCCAAGQEVPSAHNRLLCIVAWLAVSSFSPWGFDRSSSTLPTTTLIAPGNLQLIGQSIPDASLLPGSYLTGVVRNTAKPGLPALSNIAEQRGEKELNKIIYSFLHEALFLVIFFFLLLCPVNQTLMETSHCFLLESVSQSYGPQTVFLEFSLKISVFFLVSLHYSWLHTH